MKQPLAFIALFVASASMALLHAENQSANKTQSAPPPQAKPTNSELEAAKIKRVEADLEILSIQLQLYEARNMRAPSTEQGLMALVKKPTTAPLPEKWLPLIEAVTKDPWGHEYRYRCPAIKAKRPYDVYSIGKDGVEGTDDDIGNWTQKAAKANTKPK
jgi:general secretion pathway protein G